MNGTVDFVPDRHAWFAAPITEADEAGLADGVAAPADFLTRPIATWFAACVARSPGAVAVICGSERVTYADLAARGHRLAVRMEAVTMPGAPVAVVMPRGADGLTAILACILAGRICLVLDAAHSLDRLLEILADARPSLVIGGSPELLSRLPAEIVALPLHPEPGTADAALPPSLLTGAPLGQDEPAFIVYTSGSTGCPKGIVASQRAILCRMWRMIDPCGLGPADCLLATTHPGAMSGLAFMLGALLSGTRQCLFDLTASGAGAMRDLIARERVTVLIAGPALMRMLLDLDGVAAALGSLRIVRSAADALLWSDLRRFRAALPLGCRIATSYASTEGMMIAHWFIPADFVSEEERLPAGYLLADHEYALETEGEGLPARRGEVGELILRSRHIALGEWQSGRFVPGRLHPDPTANDMRIFRTGDIVSVGLDGLLRVVGRADRQIKIRGQRIEPAEIEAAMRAVPGVADAALIASREGADWRLRGVVAPIGDPPPLEMGQMIRGHLIAVLPRAMVPGQIVVVPQIPRLPIGKVDLVSLDAMLAVVPEVSAAAVVTPGSGETRGSGDARGSGAVRSAVARAWGRTLDRQSLADDLAFDEAGGDSLRFLIFIYHMEEQLGTTLPLDLFDLSMSPSMVRAAVDQYVSGGAPALAGDVPVVFLLPGIGGDEPRLVRFREACGDAFRIVTIDYGSWRDWVRPEFDLEMLLTQTAADIEARAPTGPLMLAGYSLGGFMAYAVAARLAASGRTIRVVGLLDANNLGAGTLGASNPASTARAGPANSRRYDRNEELRQIVAGFHAGIPGNALARAMARRLTSPRWGRVLPLATRLSNARLPWNLGYYLRGHLRIGLLTRFIDAHRANFAPLAAAALVPLVLFRSNQRQTDSDDLGWAGYGQAVTVIPVEGDHFNMFDPPHLRILAERFVGAMQPFVSVRSD